MSVPTKTSTSFFPKHLEQALEVLACRTWYVAAAAVLSSASTQCLPLPKTPPIGLVVKACNKVHHGGLPFMLVGGM
jgi:hypothetical protein